MSTRLMIVATIVWVMGCPWHFASAAPPRDKQRATPTTEPATQPALPGGVEAMLGRRFPGDAVLGFEHQVDDGRHLYFVDLKTEQGEETVLASGMGQYLGLIDEDDKTEDDGDVFIQLSSAPTPVKKAIDKNFNKEAIDKLFIEVENEQFIFCAEQTKADKTKWLSFTPKGELLEDETEVTLKDLPAEVTKGISDAKPAAKLKSASFVKVSGPPASTHYSVDVVDGADKLTLVVTSDGKVQSSEAWDDDVAAGKQ